MSTRAERLRRHPQEGHEERATTLELFYDLVFVFAITQVSHVLLEHLTWEGAGQALIMLLAVYWAWNYTTWVTNELDPRSIAVRVLVIGLMLGSLVMAVAVPEAFGDKALLFAGSYVAIQVGRHLLLTFYFSEAGTLERMRAGRILVWFLAAGALWIAGALADGTARTLLWIAALAIDYGAPMAMFWLPGRGRLPHQTWQVETSHFTERFHLFLIIALGESIVLIGATTSELPLDTARVFAFGVAFLTTAALWWLYFNFIATVTVRQLERSEERTRLARDVYTYLHVVVVAGILLTALGNELVIAHPGDELPANELLATAGGPVLYLLSHAALRFRISGTLSPRRIGGAAGCALVGVLGIAAPALVVGSLLTAVLVGVIAADHVVARRRRMATV